jgi:hypothetical protein
MIQAAGLHSRWSALVGQERHLLCRQKKRARAKKNKVEKNVIFYNDFVELENLKEFIGAADLYITPYLNEAQITSGALAYTFGGQSRSFDA